ncbi:MAG: DUF1697 domain-containing protein [Euryarchaeota archaeon]|nr:DUF1697 domain-containing protein [Euryarchaeota archaeon]
MLATAAIGDCVTNTNQSGTGSLKQAMLDANANPDSSFICFNIPGSGVHWIVSPSGGLPVITAPVTIDGTTQPGWAVGAPVIQIQGTSGAGISILKIDHDGAGSTIKGLIIHDQPNPGNAGIRIVRGNGHVIQGNFIGTDSTGMNAVPIDYGVRINGSSNVTIGGAGTGEGNLISGNSYGISVEVASAPVIKGNIIGLSATGDSRLSNGQSHGIVIEDTPDAIIGGSIAGEGNVIGDNGFAIEITGSGSTGSRTQGNRIGVAMHSGANMGNTEAIVFVNVPDATVGGTLPGEGNVIAFTKGTHDGVAVTGTSTRITIRGNSIHNNSGLGIDLADNGVTQNDATDPDTGPNGLQNFPSISAVTGGNTIVGNLSTMAPMPYRLDFFSNPACDTSGYGEGETYLGSMDLFVGDPSGIAPFNYTNSGPIPQGRFLTATATAPGGSTSEFGPCYQFGATAPTVSVSATDGNASESGPDPGKLTITRNGTTATALTINFTLGGSASNPADYILSGNATLTTAIIPIGASSVNVTVTPVDDSAFEPAETVVLTLGTGSYTIGSPDNDTVTIADNDGPVVTVTASDASASETGPGTGTFMVARTGATTSALTVGFAITGTATNVVDYALSGNASSSTVTIPAGALAANVTVTPVDDASIEAAETSIMTLQGSPFGAYTLGSPSAATVTIADNDVSGVTLSLAGSPMAEAAGMATLTASLPGATTHTVTVNLGFTGVAIFSTDYSRSSASITINPGQSSGTATLTAIQDSLIEGDETIIVDIVSVSGDVEAGTQQVTATIIDDDGDGDGALPNVTLSLVGSPMAEAAGVATVWATLSAATTQTVTVDLTFSGTALLTSDYTRSATSIVISIGTTTGTVSLGAVQDTVVDPGETIVVDISNVTNAVEVGTQQVTATITDDDGITPTVTLSLTDSPMPETGGIAYVTATLSKTTNQTVTVFLAFTGTANLTGDYTPSDTTIVIGPTGLTSTIMIWAASDSVDEADETVIVDISSVTNAIEAGTQQVTAVITDDDEPSTGVGGGDSLPTVTLDLTGSPISENAGVAYLALTLSAPTNQTVTVYLAFTGTAFATTDYTPSGTSVVIFAGATSGAITLTAIQDSNVEGTETIVVDISSVTNALESGTQQGTAVITDDDVSVGPSVTLSLSGSPMKEDGGSAIVTATLSNLASKSVTVNLTFTGTASFSGDYGRSGAVIVIPAGSKTGTITLTGHLDSVFEPDETVVIDIKSVTNAVEAGVQKVAATIVDEDAAGPFSGTGGTGNATVNVTTTDGFALEDDGSPGTFRIVRTGGGTTGVLSVAFVVGGTAAQGGDYLFEGTSGAATASIPDGFGFVDVNVKPVDDAVTDPGETVILTLAPGPYIIGSPSAAAVTILEGNDTNHDPVFKSRLTKITIYEGQPLILGVAAIDPDMDNVTVAADLQALPPGNSANFKPFDNVLQWTPTYDDARPQAYAVSFKAEDGRGGSSVLVVDITVLEVTTPEGPVGVPGALCDSQNRPAVDVNITSYATAAGSVRLILVCGRPETGTNILRDVVIDASVPDDAALTLDMGLLVDQAASSHTVKVVEKVGLLRDSDNASNAFEVNISAKTTIGSSNPQWDGKMILPMLLPNSAVVAPDGGTTLLAIEVGEPGATLTFDHPVRILLPAEAGRRVGFRTAGGSPTEIFLVCDSATAPTNIPAGKECKIDVGNGLVVWSDHLTTFFTFATSSSGGGGTTVPPSPWSLQEGGFLLLLIPAVGFLILALVWRREGRYVVFLRGPYVEETSRFSPTDLRRWLEDAGFTHVTTARSSGDILLSSRLRSSEAVATRVGERLAEKMPENAVVTARSAAEMKGVASRAPFEDEPAETAAMTSESMYREGFAVVFEPKNETFAVAENVAPHSPEQGDVSDQSEVSPAVRPWVVVKALVDEMERRPAKAKDGTPGGRA